MGEMWGSKLSVLEGFGVAAGLAIWAEEVAKRGAVSLMCDNLEFVFAFRKGHSKDIHIYSLAKLVHDVGLGLGAQVRIFHTGRRTSVGDKVVDHLSKYEMDDAHSLVPNMLDVRDRLPRTMENWINKPRPCQDLGRKVLVELSRKFPVKLGRDYRADMEASST